MLLAYTFHGILRLKFYPLQWKYVQLIMILKPGKLQKFPSSHGPISFWSILSKMFEKLLLDRIHPIVDNYNVIPAYQFGLRQHHGIVGQSHRVYKELCMVLEERKYCSAVSSDIQQTFDKVWHLALPYKVKQIFPAQVYCLLLSYLEERTRFVNISGVDSTIRKIAAVVPQDSVLGPMLYTIYTSDMPAPSNIIIVTFDDGTAVLATHESAINTSNILQEKLNNINSWFKHWNIKVNAIKSVINTYHLLAGKRRLCSNIHWW